MRHLACVLLTAVVVGCDAGPQESSGAMAEVRDSAGIELIHVTHPGFGAEADLVLATPLFRTEWDDEELLLERVTSGHLQSNGGMVITDAGASRIHFLGADGMVLRSIGGSGQGPGEFGQITSTALLPGDSLLVMDRRNLRAAMFTPHGDLVRSWRVPFSAVLNGSVGTTAKGEIVWGDAGYRPVPTPGTAYAPVLTSVPPHEDRDTVALLRLTEVVAWPGRDMALPRPVAEWASQAAVPEGIAHIPADSASVWWIDSASGQPFRHLTWDEEGPSIDDELWGRFVSADIDARTAQGASPSDLAERRTQLDDQRSLAPDRAPISSNARSGGDGSIWLQGWSLETAARETEWLVVLSDGRCMVRVRGENGFQFLDSANGRVLGRETSPLGVHAVVTYQAPRCPISPQSP